jgi:DHA1 family inner membrane transport protein
MAIDLNSSPRPTHVRAPELVAVGAVQVIAALIISAMPAIVSALTRSGRLNDAMAGYVVGFDLASQVAGTVVYLKYGRRTSWSTALSTGIVLMVAGNVLSCCSGSSVSLLATRLIAGIGAGAVRAACLVAFARASNPAGAIAGLNMAQIVSQGVAFATFPWLTQSLGWFGPYLALSVLGIATLGTARWWPRVEYPTNVRSRPLAFGRAGTLCIVAVFLYFLAQSAVWAFAEAIGAGLGRFDITAALEFAAFAGLAASAVAFVISTRWSNVQSLVAGLAVTLVGLYLLTIHAGFWSFALGLGLFNFAWCATTPFEFATAAAADERGNTAAAFSASDGLGLAAGPAFAGMLIAAHRPLVLNLVAAACTTVSIVLFASANGKPRCPESARS